MPTLDPAKRRQIRKRYRTSAKGRAARAKEARSYRERHPELSSLTELRVRWLARYEEARARALAKGEAPPAGFAAFLTAQRARPDLTPAEHLELNQLLPRKILGGSLVPGPKIGVSEELEQSAALYEPDPHGPGGL